MGGVRSTRARWDRSRPLSKREAGELGESIGKSLGAQVDTTRNLNLLNLGSMGWGRKAMGLLQRLKHDLKAGLATLRLGTAQAANRALEETELLRLRLEVRRIDQQLNELYRDVGERAVSLREAGEPVERVVYDTEISRLVKEIHQLKATSEKLQAEMQEIRDAE